MINYCACGWEGGWVGVRRHARCVMCVVCGGYGCPPRPANSALCASSITFVTLPPPPPGPAHSRRGRASGGTPPPSTSSSRSGTCSWRTTRLWSCGQLQALDSNADRRALCWRCGCLKEFVVAMGMQVSCKKKTKCKCFTKQSYL